MTKHVPALVAVNTALAALDEREQPLAVPPLFTLYVTAPVPEPPDEEKLGVTENAVPV